MKFLTGRSFEGTQKGPGTFLKSRKTPAPNIETHTEPINQQTNQMSQNTTSVSVFMSATWIRMRLHPEELRITTSCSLYCQTYCEKYLYISERCFNNEFGFLVFIFLWISMCTGLNSLYTKTQTHKGG